MKTIPLDFSGYWLNISKSVPSESGVYCVYACTYNKASDKVSIRELIYIGESDDVNQRLSNHERLSDWNNRLQENEVLCYSVATIDSKDRVCAEAAMIYYHKPPCNTEYVSSFPYQTTSIQTSGRNAKLATSFTV